MKLKINTMFEFEVITCGSCGCVFALNQRHIDSMREEGGNFYCPRGCYRGWSESEADCLKKQLAQKEAELSIVRSQLESSEDRHLKTIEEKHVLEKRISKGVCAYCHRSFQNVVRHMLTKHSKCKEDGEGRSTNAAG